MSNEVMTRNSEWMNHIVNHLNRMVDNFKHKALKQPKENKRGWNVNSWE